MSDIVETFSYDGMWSHSLTYLHLGYVNPTNPVNGISIAALHIIADACPNLKSLDISIHRPEKPEKPTVKKDEGGRKLHDLQKLVFFNIPGV